MELTGNERIKSLQIGIGWLPEEKGNGLDRMFYGLASHLPHAGVHVRGYVVGSQEVAVSSGQNVQAFARSTDPLQRRIGGIRNLLKTDLHKDQYDIIGSHFALFTFPVLKYIRALPLVVHFHGPWAEESRAEGEPFWAVKAKWFLEKQVYKSAQRFIVLSEAYRHLLSAQYGIRQDKIRVVQGGVHVDRFDTELSRRQSRLRLGWDPDRPTVLVVRRLVRRMGLENMISAIVRVKEAIPEVQLLIAGSGPLRAELDDRIKAASLGKHVRLLGFMPESSLPLAYRASDLTVVPTTTLEGFGLVTVESMAAGTPVLVTNVGGLPEIVGGLSANLVLPDARIKTLAAYVIDVLRGNIELPSAKKCTAYVRAKYDWPVIASKVRSVYEEVLE